METFKDRFELALFQAKMTRADLSRKTGISESLLSHYASGKATPRRSKLKIIAKALGVSPGWLLLGEEGMVDYVTQEYIIHTYNKLNEDNQKRLIEYARILEIAQENGIDVL